MPTPPAQPILDLTIELLRVEPRVWRRLLVPGSVRLDKLHRMFQAAMGWEDCHLHSFEIGADRYGMQFDDYPDDELQEKDFTVVTAVGANERFTYEYDFGDSWEHEITVHRVWRMPKGLKFAVCLDGANACPPEDGTTSRCRRTTRRVTSFSRPGVLISDVDVRNCALLGTCARRCTCARMCMTVHICGEENTCGSTDRQILAGPFAIVDEHSD